MRASIPLLVLILLLAGSPTVASAQLLSPGRLSEPHAELEGLRNCTQCHQLGRSGVAPDRCLGCHEALAERIRAGEGYHATTESDDCASCHQDHLGTDFDLVRLDESAFDHSAVGYPLELGHTDVSCRSCHVAEHVGDPVVRSRKAEHDALDRTFLGLSTECTGCHLSESPHGEQFGGRTCAECHDVGDWTEPTGFDHATTAFPLEGLHAQVECVDCHGSGEEARYTPLSHGSCSDCHADPHGGSMEGACAGCHDVGGWHALKGGGVEGRFDHARTSFPLRGAHAVAECRACHVTGRPPRRELVSMAYHVGTAGNVYPRPIADGCASCHVGRHGTGATGGRWTACADCHGESVWRPSDFGMQSHQETAYPLTGAHLATPCAACHTSSGTGVVFPLTLPGQGCVDCHEVEGAEVDHAPYGDLQCSSCHTTEAFDLVQLDHTPLLDEPAGCASCHSVDDPHRGQFEARDCASCHGTETFDVEVFDHARTAFPLDGAHEDIECSACHGTEEDGSDPFVRYRPLGTECVDCHGGDS